MVSRHGMYEDARHRAQALDRKHEKGLAVMADGTSGITTQSQCKLSPTGPIP